MLVAHRAEVEKAIAGVLDSGNFILGSEVTAFEAEFAEFCGAQHCVGVGSGTDALTLTMKALGIGQGDEVITVSHTAIATVAAIVATGATPVLVDIDESMTMDPRCVEITPRTKAVIPVHLYGRPCKFHWPCVIEDCAQATGIKPTDIGCFSFYPTKNLGCLGDGGAVTTNNAELAARLRQMRQYGWDEQRNVKCRGVNSRLDELQAAILRVRLRHLEKDNADRKWIALTYNEAFRNLPLTLPNPDGHMFHLYVVRCAERDALMYSLKGHGIACAIHYPVPAHRTLYAKHCVVRDLPVTDKVCGEILTLPLHEPEKVIDVVRRFYS